MKAIKFTVSIEIEVLSLDAVSGLLGEAAEMMKNESISGSLLKDDGDTVRWSTESEQVDF